MSGSAEIVYAGDGGLFKVCTSCGGARHRYDFYRQRRGSLGVTSACADCSRRDGQERYRAPGGTKDKRSTSVYRDHKAQLAAAPHRKEKQRAYDASTEAKARRASYERTEKCREFRKRHARLPHVKSKRAAAQRDKRACPEFRAKELARLYEGRRAPTAKAARAAYVRMKRKTDVKTQCAEQARYMLRRCLDAAGLTKQCPTAKALGYTSDQLRQRIEVNFKPGMSWGNRDAWHIDHTKPISAFLAEGISSPRLINALCNLRPLWKGENSRKWAKWPLPRHEEAA